MTLPQPVNHAVLVCLAHDYGNADAGPSFEIETFLPALRRFFARVTVFAVDDALLEHGYFALTARLRELIRREAPTLLFCVPFENQLDWDLLRDIRADRLTTSVAWMCDDHWRWNNFSRYIADAFDFVVTTDREAFAAYHGIAASTPILSQWGVDSQRLERPDVPRDIDVSFVGRSSPHRRKRVATLRGAGIPVMVRGSNWSEGRATTDELAAIPARSRISLNFSDSSKHLHGRTQLKARPFELAASGTCVLTEADPQLSIFYEPSREVVVVDSPRALVREARRLLLDEESRQEIARRGYARTVRDHTYDVRLGRIFAAMHMDIQPRLTLGDSCVTK